MWARVGREPQWGTEFSAFWQQKLSRIWRQQSESWSYPERYFLCGLPVRGIEEYLNIPIADRTVGFMRLLLEAPSERSRHTSKMHPVRFEGVRTSWAKQLPPFLLPPLLLLWLHAVCLALCEEPRTNSGQDQPGPTFPTIWSNTGDRHKIVSQDGREIECLRWAPWLNYYNSWHCLNRSYVFWALWYLHSNPVAELLYSCPCKDEELKHWHVPRRDPHR